MTFCLNFLLECCEFEAEDEHTIDNFLLAALDAMKNTDLQYWMTCFIMEVRKKGGSNFTPNTLHHI